MQIFLFGYIFIAILIIILLKSKSIKELFKNYFILEAIYSLARINVGYFIKIGTMEIEYHEILLALLFILSIFILAKNRKVNKNCFTTSLLLLFSVIIGMVLCYFWPSNEYVVDFSHSWDKYVLGDFTQLSRVSFSIQAYFMFFRLLIFLFLLNIIRIYYTKDEIIQIAKRIHKYLKYFIIFGVIEFICAYIFNYNITTFIDWFFGRGKDTYNTIIRLKGLSREPSYYAIGLYNFILLSMYISYFDNKKYDGWILISLFLGFISTSFSFILCIISIIVQYIFIIINKSSKDRKMLIIISIFMFLIILTYIVFSDNFILYISNSNINILNRLSDLLGKVKNYMGGYSDLYFNGRSETVRICGSIMTLKAGLSRPLFGLGIGTSFCLIGLVSMFSNIGLIGLITWIILMYKKYTSNINVWLFFLD